ncbi:MAG: hypothetical protein WBS24_11890 [Terriglobales bacterium]
MNPLASTKCAVRLLMAMAAIASALFISSCGSSSSLAKPNNQGYSNSNLSGTYVFSSTGIDSTNGLFLAIAGTFTTGNGGNGQITGGMIDINGFSLTSAISTSITSGTYTVNPDGRGTATLQFSGGSTTLDFVLAGGPTSGASTHGLVTEFDGNGTGSGTLDLQNAGALQGSYAFGLVGASDTNDTPLAMAGEFASGGSISGLADINSDGGLLGSPALTLSGSVTAGSPGTASLTTSVGTYHFDVYMIDDTHLKFIETDSAPIMAGDAFSQQTSISNGIYAYAMDGLDNNGYPLALAGFFTAGSGSSISAGLEDYNDSGTGTVNQVGFGGSYTGFSGGRTQITLTGGFFNGNSAVQTATFAAYPSTGGIELLEIDGAGITTGFALPQGSTTTLATSQGYGLNISAFNSGSGGGAYEEDDIAQFDVNSTGSNYNGVEDINDEGSTTSSTFNGTLTTSSEVPGYGAAGSTSGEINFNYYLANNGATALILETDQIQSGTGVFELQNSTQNSILSSTQNAGQSRAAGAHFSIAPLRHGKHSAGKKTSR